jgi:hypothetical protein
MSPIHLSGRQASYLNCQANRLWFSCGSDSLGCVPQHFDNVPSQMLVYLPVTRYRLRNLSARVLIPVVFRAVTDPYASDLL